ncbi:TCAM1 protein, partial [Heliornis fulica]|nr:TCAM1 protein [Heliornis fulica]
KAHEAATKACTTSKETQEDALNSIPAEGEEKHHSTISMGSGDKFQTLRSDVALGSLQDTSPNYVVRSSPVPIGGNSALLGPRTLQSFGSPSFPSHFEISASPTVVFHTQASIPKCVPLPSQLCKGRTSGAGQPDGDRPSPNLQETSCSNRPNSPHGQDTGAQVPQTSETVLQVISHHPTLPTPEMQPPALATVKQPDRRDVSSTLTTEPPAPKENTDENQDEKQLSTGLPSSGATVDTGSAHMSTEDSCVLAGISSNSTSASISASLLPPPYSLSSTLPPPSQQVPSKLYVAPLHPSPSPAWPPPPQAVVVPAPEPDSGKFFTFVVLHASEDEIVAHRVKDLLENMGVPNGATLSEDFFIAGRSHLTCFQDAMENSAFTLLLLTKNFPCNLCMFQTNTVLMESIMNPSKRDSVIPFVPKENPLERSQIPSMLGGLMPLDENSPGFSRTVQNTFTPRRINEKKATWVQRRKLQLYQDQYPPLQNLAALHLGPFPEGEKQSAMQPQLLKHSPQQWGPPTLTVPPATYPPPTTGQSMTAQMDPPPVQPLHLPAGHYLMPGLGSIVIQHARMIQIGNNNMMQVETVTPGPQESEEEAR